MNKYEKIPSLGQKMIWSRRLYKAQKTRLVKLITVPVKIPNIQPRAPILAPFPSHPKQFKVTITWILTEYWFRKELLEKIGSSLIKSTTLVKLVLLHRTICLKVWSGNWCKRLRIPSNWGIGSLVFRYHRQDSISKYKVKISLKSSVPSFSSKIRSLMIIFLKSPRSKCLFK